MAYIKIGSVQAGAPEAHLRQNYGQAPALALGERRSVVLTTAEVKALHTAGSEVEVIPAPGAGKVVVVDGAVAFLDFVTPAYAGGRINLEYGASTPVVIGQFAAGLTTASSDEVREIAKTANLVLSVNEEVNVGASAALTAGNSPVTVTVFYHVEDL